MEHPGIDKALWGMSAAMVDKVLFSMAVKGGCGDGLFR
jgi:hypothetical protein